jgi:hypothetical protein
MRLRVDPWDPEYGASVELDDQLAPAVGLELGVEVTGAWDPIPAPARDGVPCCAFVDGVRRIDARLFAEEGGVQAPGLAGSWAVGCAWSTKPPRIGEVRVGREVVVGAGLLPDDLEAHIGAYVVTFHGSSVPDAGPLDPLRGLQNAMRSAETALAQAIIESGEAELLVADGPLGYSHPGPLIGMVKRQSRAYLDVERAQVFPRLRAGQRTPIFKLGAQRLERYSWYLRLVDGRTIDGAMAGVVRLEVDASAGLAPAQRLADLAGSILPHFASKPGHDPRAPQNLYPIGALEAHLRHRLGDALLIRRALEVRLYEEVHVA